MPVKLRKGGRRGRFRGSYAYPNLRRRAVAGPPAQPPANNNWENATNENFYTSNARNNAKKWIELQAIYNPQYIHELLEGYFLKGGGESVTFAPNHSWGHGVPRGWRNTFPNTEQRRLVNIWAREGGGRVEPGNFFLARSAARLEKAARRVAAVSGRAAGGVAAAARSIVGVPVRAVKATTGAVTQGAKTTARRVTAAAHDVAHTSRQTARATTAAVTRRGKAVAVAGVSKSLAYGLPKLGVNLNTNFKKSLVSSNTLPKYLNLLHNAKNLNLVKASANTNKIVGREKTLEYFRKFMEKRRFYPNNITRILTNANRALTNFGRVGEPGRNAFRDAFVKLMAEMAFGPLGNNNKRRVTQLVNTVRQVAPYLSKNNARPMTNNQQRETAERLMKLVRELIVSQITEPPRRLPLPPPAPGQPARENNRGKVFWSTLLKQGIKEGLFTGGKAGGLSNANAKMLINLINLGVKSRKDPRYLQNLALYSSVLGGPAGVFAASVSGAGHPILGTVGAAAMAPTIGRIAKLAYQLTPEGAISGAGRKFGKAILNSAAASNEARARWFAAHDREGHLKKYLNMANNSNGSNLAIEKIKQLMINNQNIKRNYLGNVMRRIPSNTGWWRVFKTKEQKLLNKFIQVQNARAEHGSRFNKPGLSKMTNARIKWLEKYDKGRNFVTYFNQARAGGNLNTIVNRMLKNNKIKKNVTYFNLNLMSNMHPRDRNLISAFEAARTRRNGSMAPPSQQRMSRQSLPPKRPPSRQMAAPGQQRMQRQVRFGNNSANAGLALF